jgi:hypothetical protein
MHGLPGWLSEDVLGGAISLFGSTLAIFGLNLQRWSLLRRAEAAQLALSNVAAPRPQAAKADGLSADDPSLVAQDEGEGGQGGGGGGGGCWWTLSLAVYIFGQFVQMAALAFASQTLVSALANVSLVTNVCVAHWCFGEHFASCPPGGCACSWRCLLGWDLGAMLILALGSTCVIGFAPASQHGAQYHPAGTTGP